MGLLNFFQRTKSTSDIVKENSLKLLYYLADADGLVSSEEEDLIKELANRYNVGEIEMKSIVSEFRAKSIKKAKIQYPTKQSQIEEIINDLICVMIADKLIKISEFRFILGVAGKLNQDISVMERILKPYLFGDKIGTSQEARKTRIDLQICWEKLKNSIQ